MLVVTLPSQAPVLRPASSVLLTCHPSSGYLFTPEEWERTPHSKSGLPVDVGGGTSRVLGGTVEDGMRSVAQG